LARPISRSQTNIKVEGKTASPKDTLHPLNVFSRKRSEPYMFTKFPVALGELYFQNFNIQNVISKKSIKKNGEKYENVFLTKSIFFIGYNFHNE